jgi:putative transcriptional regulator
MEPSRITEFAPLDVRVIRQGVGKSQSEFAQRIGVSLSTLQNWEQGRRRPQGPARALLKIAARHEEGKPVRRSIAKGAQLAKMNEPCE